MCGVEWRSGHQCGSTSASQRMYRICHYDHEHPHSQLPQTELRPSTFTSWGCHCKQGMAYPFTVLGDKKERFHLAANAEQPGDVVVTDSREYVHFAVELGLVDVVMRQQRLHQHQSLRLTTSDSERLRQEHVAVETLTCSTASTRVKF